MKRTKIRFLIFLGLLCILADIASSGYSVVYNDARIVAPMDYSSYVFRIQDLPMIVSLLLTCAYVLYLFILLVRTIIKNNRRDRGSSTSRKINPKLGFFGFLGFLGFLGFWNSGAGKNMPVFVFFLFFGFFGFFFEGKMSNTFRDERYKENKAKAQFTSMEIVMLILFITTLLLGWGDLMGSAEYTLTAVRIVLSLTMGLYLFLNEYLLYRYDHDEETAESED